MIFLIIFVILFIVLSLRYNWWRLPQSYSKARVLMYHSISEHITKERHNKWRVKPKDFERQMSWFARNNWKSYTMSELCELTKIPYKSFVLTFDDGYEDNYINAFPILKKYNFKATIYLVPNQKTNHWEAKNIANLSNLLTNEQIIEMQNSGLIEFGSHTMSHVNLITIDKDLIYDELMQSKNEIEKITKCKCKSFAYPYGKYNNETIKLVKEAGYTNAVTVKRGLYELNSDKFAIKRIGILGTESFLDFYLKITRIRNKL